MRWSVYSNQAGRFFVSNQPKSVFRALHVSPIRVLKTSLIRLLLLAISIKRKEKFLVDSSQKKGSGTATSVPSFRAGRILTL